MATRMTEDYIRSVGRLAYLWGWPLVNMHNRLSIMEKVPGPGLLGGIVPAAPPGSAAMLHDYVRPEERLVACPNQDVVYGFGLIDGPRGPSVIQVPDFGGRFWVYQAVDQRTDSFVRLGAMYGTEPGLYLLAPQFFAQLPEVMAEVPARPGEEAWYEWLGSVLRAGEGDAAIADLLAAAAVDADATLVRELFEFRNIGLPLPGHWSTQNDGARFGTNYLSRTAMGRANIFVNTPEETTYFYQDLDEHGDRLDGSGSYALTFPPGVLPPVRGFWSLTLYNEHHFFHPNELDRYSLGTKNKNLHQGADGSLTLIASATAPDDDDLRRNWLPAPAGPFSLYLRAYWPEQQILDGTWTPPPVTRLG
jgi:hypothetical protein